MVNRGWKGDRRGQEGEEKRVNRGWKGDGRGQEGEEKMVNRGWKQIRKEDRKGNGGK